MTVQNQVEAYFNSQPEGKRSDLLALHALMQKAAPDRLWFLDGKDETGKVVSNPNVGYGGYRITYADGTSREFYQLGLSANTAGISIYIMGLADRSHLPRMYAEAIGDAKVTGYCIKFKRLSGIDIDVLEAAIRDGLEATRAV